MLGVGIVVWAVTLAVIDLRVRRLPDLLTLPAAVVAVILAVANGVPAAVTGGLGWFLLCVVPGLLSRRLVAGGGDAKLALSLGTVAAGVGGVYGWLLAVGAASVVTLLLGLVPVVRRHEGHDAHGLPHGPGMLLATGVVAGASEVIAITNIGGW